MPRLRQSCQNLCSETKGDVPPPNPSRKKSPLLKGQLELHTFPLIKNLLDWLEPSLHLFLSAPILITDVKKCVIKVRPEAQHCNDLLV
jgi:hypothetical protein